jgi:hypothetical protein
MEGKRFGPGYIRTPADSQPRSLTQAEAQQAFAALAAKAKEIAFGYLHEGCECRAQLMIEYLETWGIYPGRAWAIYVGRKLSVVDPRNPGQPITWNNHVAPAVAADGAPQGVLVIDPSLSRTGPMALHEWAGAMRARSIEVSEVPLTQAQILDLQTERVMAGGQPLDALIFLLEKDQAPLPDVGGSGFRIGVDPQQGVSAFAHEEMQRLRALQQELQSDPP